MSKKRISFILLLSLGLMVGGLFLAFVISKGLIRLRCPFFALTKLLCPGCGNKRAALALLRLDFKAMLHFNLLFPLEMLYIARVYLVCSKNYINGGRFAYHTRADIIDILCLILILVWTVIRNCFPVFSL